MTGMVALLAVVRNKLLALTIWALTGAAVGGVINMLLPVVYETSAKILIVAPYWNDSTANADPNMGGGKTLAYGDEFTQQRMASYARLVTTPLVTARVAERLHLGRSGEDLAAKLNGHVIPDTVVLQVKAQDSSPTRAAAIADAAAQQTIYVIKELERPPHSVVSPLQPVFTEPASVPSRPISPRTLLNIICGAVVGFLFGLTYVAAYVAARESRRVARLRDDAGQGTDGGEALGKVLGVLTADEPQRPGEVRGDVKLLRLELAHRLTEAGAQSLMISSPRPSPAASIVATSLATDFAEAGASVAVVCADFSAERDGATVGLGDLLCTRLTLDSVIRSDEARGIDWIPAGTPPANPTRELTGAKMCNLLIDLAGRYRYVIVLGPTVLELADAVDMASQVGASVLVDLVPQTPAEELRESARLLRLARGAYLGRVVVASQAFSEGFGNPQLKHRRTAA